MVMISIAMAAYNGEKYIKEQLNSILAQTEQDFEVVVCDDVSTYKLSGKKSHQ
jgi:glycosyltransferase involved in cell wall biosynthesis